MRIKRHLLSLLLIPLLLIFIVNYCYAWECPCNAHAQIKCAYKWNPLSRNCIEKWTKECEGARWVAEQQYNRNCKSRNDNSPSCKSAKILMEDIKRRTGCYR